MANNHKQARPAGLILAKAALPRLPDTTKHAGQPV